MNYNDLKHSSICEMHETYLKYKIISFSSWICVWDSVIYHTNHKSTVGHFYISLRFSKICEI